MRKMVHVVYAVVALGVAVNITCAALDATSYIALASLQTQPSALMKPRRRLAQNSFDYSLV